VIDVLATSDEPDERKKELLSAANRSSSYDFEAVSFTASGPTLRTICTNLLFINRLCI